MTHYTSCGIGCGPSFQEVVYTAKSGIATPRRELDLIKQRLQLARRLVAKIVAEIQRRRLTQSQAAAILGIDQPKVSALKQGKLSGFSIERLMRLLRALGRDIEITVKQKSRSRSMARLRVA